MTTIPFYGQPHAEVAPLELTITRVNGRWYMAFVEDDELQLAAPDWVETEPITSYASDYHARVHVWAYARKYIGQEMTVIYRGDLEG